MTAVFSLLIVLSISFLITRFGTAALTLTGVSHDLARLQSVSAFTGVGFTTSESEQIVNHPARRRILIVLMILGNAGIVTAVSTLLLSFLGATERNQWLSRGALLIIGLAVLWLVATSKWIEHHLSRVLQAVLQRFTDLEALDFAELLDLSGRYTVRTLHVEADDWVEGKSLSDTQLFQEGVTVLGIQRENGRFLGVPRGETAVETGDELVLYGRKDRLSELDDRRRGSPGDEAHARAVSDQQEERRSQQAND
ncbi:MAG: potassium transporter TrkA [Planctomycetota bacterium]|nr:MAG: potassium transporter TrkA [Planctomycetota bacterium]